MEWYNVLVIILGGIGGIGGLISLYHAKSNKTKIDIGNMKQMLDEAHKMYDEMREEKNTKQKEFNDYKAENMKYIAEFKARFIKLEKRLDSTENMVFHLKGAIFQGYRCKFPPNSEDCPVIKEYEKAVCEGCEHIEEANIH